MLLSLRHLLSGSLAGTVSGTNLGISKVLCERVCALCGGCLRMESRALHSLAPGLPPE